MAELMYTSHPNKPTHTSISSLQNTSDIRGYQYTSGQGWGEDRSHHVRDD